MSTDDLTKALRIAGQCRGFANPSRSERAIIALAAEVDRLRPLWGEALEERDAARAALERVRALADTYTSTPGYDPGYEQYRDAVTRALEGES